MDKYLVEWIVEGESCDLHSMTREYDLYEAHEAITRYANLKMEIDGGLLRPISRTKSKRNAHFLGVRLLRKFHGENPSSVVVCHDDYYTDHDNAMYALVALQLFTIN